MQLSLPDHIERQTFIAALHVMPDRPVEELFEFIDAGSERAQKLGSVTVGEVLGSSSPQCLLRAQFVLELAPRLSGRKFDQLALSVLNELYPKSAKAGFLRQRLGVPRWRIQASMQRLIEQGEVSMSGKTSDRRYVANRDVSRREPSRA